MAEGGLSADGGLAAERGMVPEGVVAREEPALATLAALAAMEVEATASSAADEDEGEEEEEGEEEGEEGEEEYQEAMVKMVEESLRASFGDNATPPPVAPMRRLETAVATVLAEFRRNMQQNPPQRVARKAVQRGWGQLRGGVKGSVGAVRGQYGRAKGKVLRKVRNTFTGRILIGSRQDPVPDRILIGS